MSHSRTSFFEVSHRVRASRCFISSARAEEERKRARDARNVGRLRRISIQIIIIKDFGSHRSRRSRFSNHAKVKNFIRISRTKCRTCRRSLVIRALEEANRRGFRNVTRHHKGLLDFLVSSIPSGIPLASRVRRISQPRTIRESIR